MTYLIMFCKSWSLSKEKTLYISILGALSPSDFWKGTYIFIFHWTLQIM